MWHPQRFSGGWLCIDLYPQRFPCCFKPTNSLKMAATGTRNGTMINGGGCSKRYASGRLIPKRGQVKLGIVLGLANSFASIFSPSSNKRASSTRLSHRTYNS
ncbi:hypothetical protein CICLE_v10017282mg [Citrus x clementina]|uniref:Uncharacterized protein n=1 Tax=Citrus clementina TaxID=85681 RepID=V4UE85_CITCL|nr:hypothetical protein CICLE_v10017282mg [Citrus x clementina]